MRRVWDWQNLKSWETDFWSILSDILNDEIIAEFKREPPEYIVSDNLSWLDLIIEDVTGQEIDIKEVFTQRLLRNYDAIKAFHGARPRDIEAYYKNGMFPLDPKKSEDLASSIFLTEENPELSNDHLESAISEVGTQGREGLIWFEANEELLIKHGSHYMLYGSEYLTAIAAHLPNGSLYQQKLKNFGTPTVFICDVPLSYIDYNWFKQFSGMAIEAIFETILDPLYPHPGTRGAGLCIKAPLPPEFIIGHYHPTELPDYLAK